MGSAFDKPLLTPYEASVALKVATLGDDYPMDFYANVLDLAWTVDNVVHELPVTCVCNSLPLLFLMQKKRNELCL